jgi:hypothetical protein
VISTATQGDVDASAIGDAIVAIHLDRSRRPVCWIEQDTRYDGFPLVDEAKSTRLCAP